jgi:hypothetical protein
MAEQYNEMGRLWTRTELATEAGISIEAMRKRQLRGLHGLELIAPEATKEKKVAEKDNLDWFEDRWTAIRVQQDGQLTEAQERLYSAGLTPIGAKPVTMKEAAKDGE